jgi:hypothetical protein
VRVFFIGAINGSPAPARLRGDRDGFANPTLPLLALRLQGQARGVLVRKELYRLNNAVLRHVSIQSPQYLHRRTGVSPVRVDRLLRVRPRAQAGVVVDRGRIVEQIRAVLLERACPESRGFWVTIHGEF